MKQHETQPRPEQPVPGEDELRPFNDVTEHYRNIVGTPSRRADLRSMPAPVRWFAYFFYSVIVVGFIAFVVSWLVQ